MRQEWSVLGITFLVLFHQAWTQQYGDSTLVYEWSKLDFDWSSCEKAAAVNSGAYVAENNLLAGIKVYNNVVYLTIPRWRSSTGIPATLVKVVEVQGQAKLRPYPDWPSQKVGDCQALQYVQSMEIDSNTGRMYVIDSGRIATGLADATPINLCPAKIVVYDLKTDTKVDSYDLPDNVVGRTSNSVNDIVLDYVEGSVRYAYISDVTVSRMYVYDFLTRTAHSLMDSSMNAETDGGSIFHINGQDYNFPAGVDGIAMSPDFDYVYYCALGGLNLYQVPTSTLRTAGNAGIRLVGKKISQSDGMVFSNKRLYYGAIGLNAVYAWDAYKAGPACNATLNTQTELVRDDQTMQWADTFAIDEQGWLWFVSNRLHLFFFDKMDFSGSEINMRVWKVFINETSYLHNANIRTCRNQL